MKAACPERPGDIRAIRLDASRALDRWGWSPRVPLENGMAAAVAWFREQG